MAGMPEMPGFDPQAMRQAADMMASMSPEALEQMTSMAAAREAVAGQQAPPPIPEMQQPGTQEALQAMQVCPCWALVASSYACTTLQPMLFSLLPTGPRLATAVSCSVCP